MCEWQTAGPAPEMPPTRMTPQTAVRVRCDRRTTTCVAIRIAGRMPPQKSSGATLARHASRNADRRKLSRNNRSRPAPRPEVSPKWTASQMQVPQPVTHTSALQNCRQIDCNIQGYGVYYWHILTHTHTGWTDVFIQSFQLCKKISETLKLKIIEHRKLNTGA